MRRPSNPRSYTSAGALLATVVVVLTALVAVPAPSSAGGAPAIKVSRTTGLTHGDVVTVTGSRLTPRVPVLMVQCVTAPQDDSGNTGCEVYRYVTTDRHGQLSAKVTLRDPVYMLSGTLDPPQYCRADHCRIFLAWTDRVGNGHVLESPELQFVGSPATITAHPASDLPAEKWIRVRGTAFGAEGHTVKIYEAACGRRSNEPECFSSLPVRWAKVHSDGTFTTVYPARRFLPDGTDCVDGSFETFGCQMTVTVLDSLGRRDDSFGVSGRGVPRADLIFAAS